jgi:hypothetical protein
MIHPTETLQDILLAAHAQQPYASSNKTAVYELPDMPEFLLRVPKEPLESFRQRLQSTSSLYPVHLCARNFGQPILSNGDHIDIIRKVEGESLERIYNSGYHSSFNISFDSIIAQHQGYKKVLSALATLPVEAYEDILKQVDYMNKKGIAADLHWGNLLLDSKNAAIHIVDLHPHNQETNIITRKQAIQCLNQMAVLEHVLFYNTHKITSPESSTLENAIHEKLQRAIKNTGITLSHEEIEHNIPTDRAYFAQALDIRDNLGTIALNNTPHAMRELIRRTEEYSQQPER